MMFQTDNLELGLAPSDLLLFPDNNDLFNVAPVLDLLTPAVPDVDFEEALKKSQNPPRDGVAVAVAQPDLLSQVMEEVKMEEEGMEQQQQLTTIEVEGKLNYLSVCMFPTTGKQLIFKILKLKYFL